MCTIWGSCTFVAVVEFFLGQALQGIEDVGGSEGLVNVADEEKGDVAGTTCEVSISTIVL